MPLTNYNTIQPTCVERCSLARLCGSIGLLPEVVIAEAADAADIRYASCHKADGPELLSEGTEICGLSIEAQRVVRALVRGAKLASEAAVQTPQQSYSEV